MVFKVLVGPLAFEDLISIHLYIADRAGDDIADAYLDRIEERCRAIGNVPFGGTPRDDLVSGLRTVPFERRATIAYTVANERVVIQRVLHAGRDLTGAF